MRILIIDEEFPHPLDSGKRIRSFSLLSRLARHCDMRYLAYGAAGTANHAALQAAGMNPQPVPATIAPQSGPLFYARLMANLFSADPYIVTRHHSRVFSEELARVVRTWQPDLIVCEWTPYANFVKGLRGIPRVVVAHNMEQRIWQRYYEHERRPHRKWYIGRQAVKVASFERRAFGWMDGAVAVSSAEADEIRTINPGLSVAVVENGVDLAYFRPKSGEPEPDTLIYVGAMHWRPNQDAVTYFVEQVLPLVRRQRPEVRFRVVGKEPPPRVRALGALPGVEIVGEVPDVRPYIDSAAVYVVPLRIGGGTRLKILEALAMRKAVISTAVGAEGLAVTDGVDIILADDPETMAAQIDRLCGDADLRTRLGGAGRALVEETYGWDSLAEKLRGFLESLPRAA